MDQVHYRLNAVFEEFQKTAVAQYHEYFSHAAVLEDIVNAMFRSRRHSNLREKVVRDITWMVAGDYSAVLALVMNGFGIQALKIARSMFEAECNVSVLRSSDEEVRNFVDFHAVRTMRAYEDLLPEDQDSVEACEVMKIKEKYERVKAPFTKENGKVRDSWTPLSVAERAKRAGRRDKYQHFYRFASSLHHYDIEAVEASFNYDLEDVETAPSLTHLHEALHAATESLQSCLEHFDEVAAIGFGSRLAASRNVIDRLENSLLNR